jgi:hypothetical protein
MEYEKIKEIMVEKSRLEKKLERVIMPKYVANF